MVTQPPGEESTCSYHLVSCIAWRGPWSKYGCYLWCWCGWCCCMAANIFHLHWWNEHSDSLLPKTRLHALWLSLIKQCKPIIQCNLLMPVYHNKMMDVIPTLLIVVFNHQLKTPVQWWYDSVWQELVVGTAWERCRVDMYHLSRILGLGKCCKLNEIVNISIARFYQKESLGNSIYKVETMWGKLQFIIVRICHEENYQNWTRISTHLISQQ